MFGVAAILAALICGLIFVFFWASERVRSIQSAKVARRSVREEVWEALFGNPEKRPHGGPDESTALAKDTPDEPSRE